MKKLMAFGMLFAFCALAQAQVFDSMLGTEPSPGGGGGGGGGDVDVRMKTFRFRKGHPKIRIEQPLIITEGTFRQIPINKRLVKDTGEDRTFWENIEVTVANPELEYGVIVEPVAVAYVFGEGAFRELFVAGFAPGSEEEVETSFVLVATDDDGHSVVAEVEVLILPRENEPPDVPSEYHTQTYRGEQVDICVPAWDDGKPEPLRISDWTDPSHGWLSIPSTPGGPDGPMPVCLTAVTYHPDPDWWGEDSFTVVITDGEYFVETKVFVETLNVVVFTPEKLTQVIEQSGLSTELALRAVGWSTDGEDEKSHILLEVDGITTILPWGERTAIPIPGLYIGIRELAHLRSDDGLKVRVVLDIWEEFVVENNPPKVLLGLVEQELAVEQGVHFNVGKCVTDDGRPEPLHITGWTTPLHGFIEQPGDCGEFCMRFNYTPNKGFEGLDSFVVMVSDGEYEVSVRFEINVVVKRYSTLPVGEHYMLKLDESGDYLIIKLVEIVDERSVRVLVSEYIQGVWNQDEEVKISLGEEVWSFGVRLKVLDIKSDKATLEMGPRDPTR
ncbi:MAG: hypothetical protein ISS36_03410 [Candidatus Aenigmarchaeota archaeon]|nr:hypothetical protein [Candidatus Aenigmarchaeota archaeon]